MNTGKNIIVPNYYLKCLNLFENRSAKVLPVLSDESEAIKDDGYFNFPSFLLGFLLAQTVLSLSNLTKYLFLYRFTIVLLRISIDSVSQR